jgi:penicillin-binding protein 1B
LEAYYPRLTRGDSPVQAALIALDPETGEILAMVGGRDYGQSQFNRATMARRQPGSAFKPIVALTALAPPDQRFAGYGAEYTLASTLEDRPLAVPTGPGMWRPSNYDGDFRGEITLREALEQSLNVPFARLGMAIGPERIVRTANTLGIESYLNPVPSLALGSSEVTLLEMTRAFGVFAAGGVLATTQSTLGILDGDGNNVEGIQLDRARVYDPAEAYLVTSALRTAVDRGTGHGIRDAGYRGDVAGKSGTTNDFRDAWYVGYTPDIVVGVWVGFDDGRSLGLSGSLAALPIFSDFLMSAGQRFQNERFTMPVGIETAEVGSVQSTGRVICDGTREIFLRGTVPESRCRARWPDYRRRYDTRFSDKRTSRSTRELIRRSLRRLSSGRRGAG